MSYSKFKYAALGACAASALLATEASAQSESVTGATVNLTVQNSFNLAETTAMDFGTLAVFCAVGNNETTTATLSNAGVLATGAPTANGAAVIDIDGANRTQAVFDITGAAPTTPITISRQNITNMTCAACGGGNPLITTTSISDDTTAGDVTTDGNGAATINSGAVLTTLASCATQYADGAYQATYDLTATY